MKTAIIGVGVIGQVHADVLSEQKRDVVAVCDIDAERWKKVPAARGYFDYQEMIEKEKPDVIHICTPHYLHAEMAVYALERGINVLCEKPLCIKKEDIARILEAERNSTAQLGVCFQNRYVEKNGFVKRYLDGKRIDGAVATVFWTRGAGYYNSATWRGTQEQEGGGVLINQAIHTLDLLQWLVGEPKYVTSSVANLKLKGVIEVEDTVTAIYDGDANFMVCATNGSPAYFPIELLIRAEGETIRISEDRVTVDNKVVEVSATDRYFGKPCYGAGHAGLIEDFYDCIATGRKFPIDGAEGAKAVRLVLAAYESNGNRIKISE